MNNFETIIIIIKLHFLQSIKFIIIILLDFESYMQNIKNLLNTVN